MYRLIEKNGFKALLIAGDEIYVKKSLCSGIVAFDEIKRALT